MRKLIFLSILGVGCVVSGEKKLSTDQQNRLNLLGMAYSKTIIDIDMKALAEKRKAVDDLQVGENKILIEIGANLEDYAITTENDGFGNCRFKLVKKVKSSSIYGGPGGK